MAVELEVGLFLLNFQCFAGSNSQRSGVEAEGLSLLALSSQRLPLL